MAESGNPTGPETNFSTDKLVLNHQHGIHSAAYAPDGPQGDRYLIEADRQMARVLYYTAGESTKGHPATARQIMNLAVIVYVKDPTLYTKHYALPLSNLLLQESTEARESIESDQSAIKRLQARVEVETDREDSLRHAQKFVRGLANFPE